MKLSRSQDSKKFCHSPDRLSRRMKRSVKSTPIPRTGLKNDLINPSLPIAGFSTDVSLLDDVAKLPPSYTLCL